jgi:hypothetical protein
MIAFAEALKISKSLLVPQTVIMGGPIHNRIKIMT